MQQQAANGKHLSDEIALAKAEKNFVESYVSEAVAEAKQEIDRERRTLVQELMNNG